MIAMSARLNAGQCGSLMKSVTEPWATRSIRLPIAPPTSRPVGSHSHGRVGRSEEEDDQRAERDERQHEDERSAAGEKG